MGAEGDKSAQEGVMRWFLIRKAKVSRAWREEFESMGVEIVRSYFTQPRGTIMFENEGGQWSVQQLHQPMQVWLREQYDRAERRETWLIAMEIAITILVAAELAMSILDFYSRYSK
jgi:hypothetical protein